MSTLLPESPEAFKDATWPDIVSHYDELERRPLSHENVETWLADWSRLESILSEAAALASFAYTCDTADEAREKAHLRFSMQISPRAQERRTHLQRRLVELGYVRPGLEMVVRRFQNQLTLFSEANVPLFAEQARLTAEWSKTMGALSVEWEGERKTPAQLLPFLEHPDRALRERAFRLRAKPYLEQRDKLASMFDQLYDVRQKIARNAGLANYRDYAHREKNRFDYTPDDCLRFHAAVEEAVTPAMQRRLARRKQKMGLAKLRPWDLLVDTGNRDALKPFTDVDSFVAQADDVFGRVDPDFQGYFRSMVDAGLLDLENRPGKAPGAYSQSLNFRRMPLIFQNAVGVDDDVRTLHHESGHAFHSFEAAKLPILFQRHPGSEMAEVASMSMELLAAPFLDRSEGGYYSTADAVRSRVDLLERIIQFFPHCASVDAHQQWIYTNAEGRDGAARDARWLELRRRFEGAAVDWTGLDSERIARWYQQPHFFSSPFYYIEYGIAQLGALQVWRNSLRDHAEAVRSYKAALALGATRPLPDLFQAAGARLVFDARGMRELIELVEEELSRLDS